MNALLTATAILALLFGIGQALIPAVLLSIFNVKLDPNAELFARSLGGSWLGLCPAELTREREARTSAPW